MVGSPLTPAIERVRIEESAPFAVLISAPSSLA
jgi:hypothetical protein